MAEKKNLQTQYVKLHNEYDRLKSENHVYFELLQSFWTSAMSRNEPEMELNARIAGLEDWVPNFG